MSSNNNLTKENQNVNFSQKNKTIKDIYINNRKDKDKRKSLREKRLIRINSYRDEQVAALKH
ncbi:MAG: hypothetical protein HFH68_00200 [Lachnospiraceae bacterium]|nr:hypothetical protein [Lachnospiraceae bacterium]